MYGAVYICNIYVKMRMELLMAVLYTIQMLSVISYQPIKLQVENIQNAYGLLHTATKIKILHLNMHAWGQQQVMNIV